MFTIIQQTYYILFLLKTKGSRLSTSLYNYRNGPCGQSGYLIGFEINEHYLNGLGRDFTDALVFIGKENPFTQGQMKPIVWQKIKTKKFPIEKSNLTEEEKQYKHKNAIKEQTYLYETNTYQIFIKDYTEPNDRRVQDRHLIVYR